MAILAVCSCGAQQKLPNSYEGKEVKCLKCGKMVLAGGEGGPSFVERRLTAGDIVLVARCEAPQAEKADEVLKRVAANQNVGVGLTDRVRIPFGWSELQLLKRGSELLVCEVDYSRNPWADVREDITVAIQVWTSQVDLARKLSVKPLMCKFSQEVHVVADCLEQEHLMIRRIKMPKAEDSGWYFGPGDPEKQAEAQIRDEFDKVQTYQLLRTRPGVIPALILPIEYIVHFNGNTITKIIDGSDRVVYGES